MKLNWNYPVVSYKPKKAAATAINFPIENTSIVERWTSSLDIEASSPLRWPRPNHRWIIGRRSASEPSGGRSAAQAWSEHLPRFRKSEWWEQNGTNFGAGPGLIIAGAVPNVRKEPVDMVNPSHMEAHFAPGILSNWEAYQSCESWVEVNHSMPTSAKGRGLLSLPASWRKGTAANHLPRTGSIRCIQKYPEICSTCLLWICRKSHFQ